MQNNNSQQAQQQNFIPNYHHHHGGLVQQPMPPLRIPSPKQTHMFQQPVCMQNQFGFQQQLQQHVVVHPQTSRNSMSSSSAGLSFQQHCLPPNKQTKGMPQCYQQPSAKHPFRDVTSISLAASNINQPNTISTINSGMKVQRQRSTGGGSPADAENVEMVDVQQKNKEDRSMSGRRRQQHCFQPMAPTIASGGGGFHTQKASNTAAQLKSHCYLKHPGHEKSLSRTRQLVQNHHQHQHQSSHCNCNQLQNFNSQTDQQQVLQMPAVADQFRVGGVLSSTNTNRAVLQHSQSNTRFNQKNNQQFVYLRKATNNNNSNSNHHSNSHASLPVATSKQFAHDNKENKGTTGGVVKQHHHHRSRKHNHHQQQQQASTKLLAVNKQQESQTTTATSSCFTATNNSSSQRTSNATNNTSNTINNTANTTQQNSNQRNQNHSRSNEQMDWDLSSGPQQDRLISIDRKNRQTSQGSEDGQQIRISQANNMLVVAQKRRSDIILQKTAENTFPEFLSDDQQTRQFQPSKKLASRLLEIKRQTSFDEMVAQADRENLVSKIIEGESCSTSTQQDEEQDKKSEVQQPKLTRAQIDEIWQQRISNVQNEIILDVDKQDLIGKPQKVVEYIQPITQCMFDQEARYMVDCNYMNTQYDINDKMRAMLNDWLIEVHLKFKLVPETLFLTVNLIDRFLARYQVHRQKLQLVGVTCMLIASKYEEIYAPEVKDFVYITDKAYDKEEILQMEREILMTLEFDISGPSPFRFLERFVKFVDEKDIQLFNQARYLIELPILETRTLQFKPSTLAASALYLAMKIKEENYNQQVALMLQQQQEGGMLPQAAENNWDSLMIQMQWTELLARETKHTEEQLYACIRDIYHLMENIDQSSLKAVKKKFSSERFGCVAK